MAGIPSRSSVWSVTINNPVGADEENISLARQKGWKVDGQLEKGENGTPHYQLIVKTGQVRFSAVKKAFPRAHIEVARNVQALEQYVHKEDTREGELVSSNDKYPSVSKLWDLFFEFVDRQTDKTLQKEFWSEDKFLEEFDLCIRDLIVRGYYVESMAVNPQIRACVKKFGRELLIRSQSVRRQTDSQTDVESISESSITEEDA